MCDALEHPTLPHTGERYLPSLGGEIALEHYHRYALARELVAGKEVLDIACGEGYGTALLATAAARVTGVDLDAGTLDHAQRRYGGLANVRFRLGSCGAIPLEDRSVD